jgi:carbon-monoxide dehydrogenase medium subunit
VNVIGPLPIGRGSQSAKEVGVYPGKIDRYEAPSSLAEAIDLLAGAAVRVRVLAGGQSALQLIRSRVDRPSKLIDLRRISTLSGIAVGDGGLRIGALTRYRDLACARTLVGARAALADAAQGIGDRQVRNMGTIGGNLCHADVTGDIAPACVAGDAVLTLVSTHGTRSVPAGEFIVGANQTVLRRDELLVEVVLPELMPRSGDAYLKYGVTFNGRAVVGVAAAVALARDGTCTHARVVVGGTSPGPVRARSAEATLIGSPLDERALTAAGTSAAAEVDMHGDMRATAAYRRQLTAVYVRRALQKAADRAKERP